VRQIDLLCITLAACAERAVHGVNVAKSNPPLKFVDAGLGSGS
jgi:hypothetical protein